MNKGSMDFCVCFCSVLKYMQSLSGMVSVSKWAYKETFELQFKQSIVIANHTLQKKNLES